MVSACKQESTSMKGAQGLLIRNLQNEQLILKVKINGITNSGVSLLPKENIYIYQMVSDASKTSGIKITGTDFSSVIYNAQLTFSGSTKYDKFSLIIDGRPPEINVNNLEALRAEGWKYKELKIESLISLEIYKIYQNKIE